MGEERYRDYPSSIDLDKMKMDKEWYPGSPKAWNPKDERRNYIKPEDSNRAGDVTILRGGKEPETKKFSKGGLVRGDGKASRGKTKGRFC